MAGETTDISETEAARILNRIGGVEGFTHVSQEEWVQYREEAPNLARVVAEASLIIEPHDPTKAERIVWALFETLRLGGLTHSTGSDEATAALAELVDAAFTDADAA